MSIFIRRMSSAVGSRLSIMKDVVPPAPANKRSICISLQKYNEVVESNVASPKLAPNRVEKTVNQISLMGRVGGDPQKRGTAEHPVVVFSLATHANYNYQNGNMLQKTDWHRVCVFKPYLRDTVYKYMTKGQRVYLTGRVSYGELEDEQGKSHVTTSIIADDVIFISDSRNQTKIE